MRQKTVDEIVRPYRKDLSLETTVAPGDTIVRAIELMIRFNLTAIGVVHNDRPVGMVRLEDAVRKLGIRMPPKP